MADKKVHLQVVTPLGIKIERDVDMVIFRATTGDMGILPGHEPVSAVLDLGVMRIFDYNEEEESYMAIFGGLAEVKDNIVTIITSLAETPEEISRSRAEEQYRLAEERVKEGRNEDYMDDHYTGPVRMRRSMVRIEVSSYSTLSSRKEHD
jgi:F-type H+-transporting ATPase subunit epsilon